MSYFKLDKQKVINCDIDDCLILWNPEEYQHEPSEIMWIKDAERELPFLPHKRNIEFLKKLKLQGFGIVCWSAAGGNWVETVIKALGLEDIPDIVVSKPDLCLDDFLEAKKILKSILWIHPDTGEFKRNE